MDYQNNITIDRLRYFIEAAKTEHIGRAAKLLHVSPSVVSSAIRQLEQELKLQFFHRNKKTIKLTFHGKALLDKAQAILLSIKDLKSDLNAPLSDNLSGFYRLGASHILMDTILVPSILGLSENRNDMVCELSSLETSLAIAQIRAGLLDLALVFRSSYTESIEENILWTGEFKIAVTEGHPLLKTPIHKRIQLLNELPAISFRSSNVSNFWEKHPALATAGISPHSKYFYDDTQTAITLLDKTKGWAFLPEFIIDRNPSIKVIKTNFPINAPVNISLVSANNQKAMKLVEKLIPELQSLVKPKKQKY